MATARLRSYVGAVGAVLAGSLALAGGASAANVNAPCSKQDFGDLKMQMNLAASEILVRCGKVPGGGVTASGGQGTTHANPFDLGAGDLNLITGTETSPRVTQSEDMVWAQGNTVVVNYNDSRASASSQFSGLSVSTDGGATFNRLGPPSPFATGHGLNFGDPIVVFNQKLGLWFAGDLATGDCGLSGGIGMWSSPDGLTWTPATCAHVNPSGGGDDREALAVDNNPASPFYGRMYVVWNNFSVANAPFVGTFSDTGTSWSAPITIDPNSASFTRVSGATVAASGTVLPYGLNETTQGGVKNYKVFRSSDGAATYGPGINMAAAQAAPGQTGGGVCGSNQNIPPIWRYEGNGQLAVGTGQILGYDYTRGDAGDQGNIYFVRSTDNGATWGAPVKLNTDAGTRAQWMPALAATPGGQMVASWYDRRNTATNDYQRFAAVSNDGGVTWGPNQPVSDVIIPQPLQPDPSVQPCYAGDYNLDFARGNTILDAWTDGRVLVAGNPQQDVFLDRISLGPSAITNGATGVGVHTATLNGLANDSSKPGSARFEYGTTTAYGTTTLTQSLGASAADQPVSQAISGLAPATTYHFRIDADNPDGTANGADQQFTTPALAHHRITIDKAGLGSGSVAAADGQINCGPTCTHLYQDEDTVTLAASPAADSTFAGWSGAGCSGTGACSLTVASDATVTATFKPSSAFHFAKPVLNKKTGTAILLVVVPDSGDISLGGKGIVPIAKRPLGKHVARAGVVKLKVKTKGKTKKRLKKKGKVRVKPKVTFTVTGGDPVTNTKKLKLVRKRG